MTDITFVDENDNILGGGTKQEALEKGIRHRIARVFLINSKGEVLMQKRGPHIFSNPDKWDQSAAGHVDHGETYEEAAYRELKEEVGVEGVPLTEIGYYYKEETDEARGKKRFNRVYRGVYDGEVHPDLDEVSEVRWIPAEELEKWMNERPQEFTEGCMLAYREYIKTRKP